jgi:hypothetical protein
MLMSGWRRSAARRLELGLLDSDSESVRERLGIAGREADTYDVQKLAAHRNGAAHRSSARGRGSSADGAWARLAMRRRSCARSACVPLTGARLGVAAGAGRGFSFHGIWGPPEKDHERPPLRAAHATLFHSFNCVAPSVCQTLFGPTVEPAEESWIEVVFATSGPRQHPGPWREATLSQIFRVCLWSSTTAACATRNKTTIATLQLLCSASSPR